MRKRLRWCVMSICALFAGALDYTLYRQDTYIGSLAFWSPLPFHWGYDFFAYYLPDFLWAFSLTFALFAILSPAKRKTILCSILTTVYGCFWEFAQHFAWVSGTADYMDILMYLAASFLAVVIKIHALRRD